MARKLGKTILYLALVLIVAGCSLIPDLPGPIGIPGI